MMEKPAHTPKAAAPACPLCGKPRAEAFRPFCSKGCRDRDLLQWMGEGYRVPGAPVIDPEAEKE